jgi:hypothetical protein
MKTNQGKVESLLEVYMLMQIDSEAVYKKRASMLITKRSALNPIEIDWRPHHQSEAPDVNDIDDVDLSLGKCLLVIFLNSFLFIRE